MIYEQSLAKWTCTCRKGVSKDGMKCETKVILYSPSSNGRHSSLVQMQSNFTEMFLIMPFTEND